MLRACLRHVHGAHATGWQMTAFAPPLAIGGLPPRNLSSMLDIGACVAMVLCDTVLLAHANLRVRQHCRPM